MTAFSAFIATSAVLLSANYVTARELTSAGDLPAGLVTATGMRCGETAFQACCPAVFGACAPGMVCMGDVCEPCGGQGQEKCDENASRIWGSTFMVEEDDANVVSVSSMDTAGGLYGSDGEGMYGGYGDDDTGSYGADIGADGGSGSGDDGAATENQGGSSANVNGGGSGGTPLVRSSPGGTPEDTPSDSSSSSIAPATAAVVGVAALVAGIGAIAYVKRASLFGAGAAAATSS